MNIKGRCIACDERTLFVGDGGWLTCSWIDCPDPSATSRLLERKLLPVVYRTIAEALADAKGLE